MPVSIGVFSTLLGDISPLNTTILNGQDLWLGVTVGADPEMTPRQPIAYVPYAVFANNADLLDGSDASSFASTSHTHGVLPRAYGAVYIAGGIKPGAYNVSSSTFDAGLNRYRIDFTGFSFSTVDDCRGGNDSGRYGQLSCRCRHPRG